MMEIETASERSVFFAFDEAPAAIAAEVPQTDVAVAIVITSGLLSILSTFVPKNHMKMITTGVTIHAMPSPYKPKLIMFEKSTENPITTSPALM